MRKSVRPVAIAVLAVIVGAQLATAADGGRAGRVVVPRFVEEAEAAGVEHAYDGDWQYFVGGGVAAFDCDADALPDLYLAGGSTPAALFHNASPTGGALRFERVTSPETDLDAVTGAYPLDIDSDGVLDLAVLRHGEDVLLRGLGDCAFERANEAWGFDGGDAWTTAFSATWEAGQTWPTLAFGNYIDHVDEQGLTHCATNVLVRPAPSGGGFAAPVALPPGACTLSMLFSDWDRSGRRDLRVSNDRHYYGDEGEEQLWRIAPGEDPRLYTREEGWGQVQIWGMGIASQDLTNDGFPEVYLTSIGDNKLQTLEGDAAQPAYRDVALRAGVTAHQPHTGGDARPSTAWHAEFDDVNNDGRVDLYVSKGNVEAMKESAMQDPSSLLLGTGGLAFRESARQAGLADFEPARGAAVVDLNRDGLLDIVEVNRRVNVQVWRNVGRGTAAEPRAMGDWLAIELAQAGPNPDAIGAWIDVRQGRSAQSREVTVGGGHASGQAGWHHLGLASDRTARVRVTWPDGEQGPWMDAEPGTYLIVERGADAPVTRVPEAG